MDLKISVIRAKILFKLARRRNWGNSHTAFDNMKKWGFKPKDHNAAKNALDELVKENLVFRKKTGYGLQVSLNHEYAKEIKQIIRDLLGENID